jgi:Pectate lyase superfamily protein/Major tropism determinant N-terminal domain
MAIVQISRIQIRRGLNQDLPQLASAEMGWSVDTQQLYIGNGTITEGAPTTGVTEILTQHSNLLGLIGLYTYQGAAGGYVVTTGVDSSHPVSRTLQSKLDDITSIRDFGAKGDGVTDDTTAINRAIQQIYSSVYNDGTPNVRRTINFPAGTYLVTNTILVPPYAKFIGDGRNNTLIVSTNGSAPIFKTVDSQYNGSGTTKPRDILIQDMDITSNVAVASLTSTLFQLDSCVNGKFVNMRFVGNVGAYNNLVYVTDSISNTRNITFDNCTFTGAGSGINVVVQGSGISSVRVNNSSFDYLANVGYAVDAAVNGFGSSHNYFGNVTVPRLFNANPTHYQFGDSMWGTGAANVAGITLGRLTTSGTVTSSIPTGTATVLGQLNTGAGMFDYQLDNGSAYRTGTVKYTVTGSATTFEDDYTETGTSLGGNLFINAAGYLSCGVTTASVLKYNLKQYF